VLRILYLAGQRSQASTSIAAAASAAGTAAAAPPPRKKKPRPALKQVLHPLLQLVRQDAEWLAAQQRRPGFLSADVSGGVERYRIPCFNEVDKEPAPSGLVYVRHAGHTHAGAPQRVAQPGWACWLGCLAHPACPVLRLTGDGRCFCLRAGTAWWVAPPRSWSWSAAWPSCRSSGVGCSWGTSAAPLWPMDGSPTWVLHMGGGGGGAPRAASQSPAAGPRARPPPPPPPRARARAYARSANQALAAWGGLACCA
jgi:hypothetical protein